MLRSEAKYMNLISVFHHVSSEHWLVEMRADLNDKDYPDAYTKAKFEVGADETVSRLAVVLEPEMKGKGEMEWAWFERV